MLAIQEQTLGPEHPGVAASLNDLAFLYDAQGNYAEAELLYQRSLAIMEKTLGAEHPDVAASLDNLASLYYAQGNYAEAEPLYRRSLEIAEKAFGAEHPSVATASRTTPRCFARWDARTRRQIGKPAQRQSESNRLSKTKRNEAALSALAESEPCKRFYNPLQKPARFTFCEGRMQDVRRNPPKKPTG